MKKLILCFLVFFLPSFPALAAIAPTALAKIVNEALNNSYALRAQKQAEQVSATKVKIEETRYIPNVNAEAIDSWGFPGSNGALGISGIMGSPYRSGFSYGLTATEMLWDFGATSAAIDTAKKALLTEKSHTAIEQWNVKQAAIDLYYGCAIAQTQTNLWTQIEQASVSVQKEVERFVHTGQRSVVDGLLAKAQTDEFSRLKSTAQEQVLVLQSRLSVLTGTPVDNITCADLFGESTAPAVATPAAKNPYVNQAMAEQELASAEVSAAKSGYLPKLVGLASVAELDRARLVGKKDYALGLGLSWPIFDGLRTPREVERANAFQQEREAGIGAAQQFTDDANLQFEQRIRSDQVAIDHLHHELEDSDHAFQVARKRYTSFSGSLVDVRESIRNYSRLRADFINIQSDWQRNISLKAAFNGGEF